MTAGGHECSVEGIALRFGAMKLVMAMVMIAACGGGQGTTSTTPPPAQPTGETEAQEVIAARVNAEGVRAMYAGNYAEASSHFREAVARVPEAKYFFNLCTSLFQEGKFAEAHVACGAVDKNDPGPELAQKTRAMTTRIEAEAKAQGVTLAISGDPGPTDEPPAPDTVPVPATGGQAAIAAKLSDEGVQLLFAQKYAEASSKFREAVARVPEAKYFFNLCTSLYQEGKFAEALSACRGVASNGPTQQLLAKTNALIDRIQAEAKRQGIELAP